MSREPGVYDLSHADYHASTDALSSTGARKLLPPSCPAAFKWWRDHPEQPRTTFDIGNAAHDTLLGGGPEIVVIPDELLSSNGAVSTKAAKEFVAEVRGRGAVPILREQHEAVRAMVEAVRSHWAISLFSGGTPEVSLFWDDERTGVARRARLDWLPDHDPKGRMLLADLKTCQSADAEQFARSAASYGYAQQAAWYLDGVRALGLAEYPVLLFVAVEKAEPHLVNVIQLDEDFMRIGAALNRDAIDLYAECVERDEWPAYSTETQIAVPPNWYANRFEPEMVV
jgi:hypothetical protein